MAGVCAGLVAAAAPTLAAAAQASPGRALVPGVAYTIRVTSVPQSGAGLMGATSNAAQSYVGHAVFAANRGRLDIVDGGADPMFAAGDYVLFDSTALVVVHPATREFVPIQRDSTVPSEEQLSSLGIQMEVSDEKVTLDSLGGADTVAGVATIHYRMITAFNMKVTAATMQQRLGTEATTDYWVAVVPGLPGNPLLRANGVPGQHPLGAMFKDLERRVDSASARMGAAVALRTTTRTRLIEGPGASATIDQTSEVSNITRRPVDVSLLTLPANYTQRASSGADGGSDAGARWRVPPRPSRR